MLRSLAPTTLFAAACLALAGCASRAPAEVAASAARPAVVTGAAAAAPAAAISVDAAAPTPAPCPEGLPAGARCFNGRDAAGAYYWMALPKDWAGAGPRVLVMHTHGGPELGAPTLERATEDLKRWSVTVRAGYAWAGSTYHRGGYGVRMAADDTERLRRLFVATFGQPRRTLLHGQSYGGGVASKAAELVTPDGRHGPYDGVLLTSGVLGGGGAAYPFRLDLRVVYQAVCANHPRPDEPQYPLWQGLPAGAHMTRADLAARVRECTGVGLPAGERTAAQKARLAAILAAVKVPERTLVAHLAWATFLFRDLTQERLGNRNPFDNTRVRYATAAGGADLNARVARYAADPGAVAALADDSRPTGRLALPTLTVHAIDDPTAFVELESVYRGLREQAGTAGTLVQTYTTEHEHSYLSDPEYAAAFAALLQWIDRGDKPTPAGIAARCEAERAAMPGDGCHFKPDYTSPPLTTRVPARDGVAAAE